MTAAIDPLGAELSSLTDATGREWMTDADPAYWAGRAPLLFPIVGALNGGTYRLDGRTYALPQHGFARRRGFDLVEATAATARFRLIDDAQTRAVYPFAFALEMAFALEEMRLTMTATIENRGDRTMPASFGYHPAFAWPLPGGGDKAAHRLVFDAAEGPIRAIEGGLIGGVLRSPMVDRTLALDDALFARDALVWDAIASRSLRYEGDGAALAIGWDAPMLGVWSKPRARFVCVEPWWGHADPVGFAGDIVDKPGMMRIAPGERRDCAMWVQLADGPPLSPRANPE